MSENGHVLTGRLIMAFNSPGILTDLLTRAAPNIVVGVWVWFFLLFILELLLPSPLKL